MTRSTSKRRSRPTYNEILHVLEGSLTISLEKQQEELLLAVLSEQILGENTLETGTDLRGET